MCRYRIWIAGKERPYCAYKTAVIEVSAIGIEYAPFCDHKTCLSEEKCIMSDGQLACIGCMTSTDLSLHAHRNHEKKIVGFVAVCPNCQEVIADHHVILLKKLPTVETLVDATPDR